MKWKHYIFIILLTALCTTCFRKVKGNGKSNSVGKVNNGELVNGRKFPWKGDNFKYFSKASYHILNRAWVHEKIMNISLAAYKECKKTCPDTKFLLMECSMKHGGRMWPHRTHQNGTSIDYGTPMLRKGKPFNFHNHYGLLHYAMKFNEDGVSTKNKNIKIDYETMGNHILALDKMARKNGMYIKKVIFKINLKDNFFASKSGKKIKRKKIYFAQKLPDIIDRQHDDHYHVDFGFL